MTTMDDVGKTNGCGRAEWEYDAELNQYGTPMAMMLLPFWTDGCIGSMEGLFFESSATTPYHFLAELGAVRGAVTPGAQPPLRPAERGEGRAVHAAARREVLHGVLAGRREGGTPAVRPAARSRRSGPWVIFEVADSELVTPLTNEPVVVKGADKNAKSWLNMSEDFFLDPTQWDVELAGERAEGMAADRVRR